MVLLVNEAREMRSRQDLCEECGKFRVLHLGLCWGCDKGGKARTETQRTNWREKSEEQTRRKVNVGHQMRREPKSEEEAALLAEADAARAAIAAAEKSAP